MKPSDLEHIFSRFETGKSFHSAEPFGDGHIHQTFRVKTSDRKVDFILQRLNNFVFRSSAVLMENLARVTSHLSEKIAKAGTGWQAIQFFTIPGGRLYYTDADGSDWRLMNYIPHDTSGINRCDIHRSAGEAYAQFISLMGDLPGPPLKETIPDFHNLEKRLADFHHAIENAIPDRKREAAGDILYAGERSDEMSFIPGMLAKGEIRLRPTHNDTKLDNILFDASGNICGVVDLDTVMPGLPHYDFGDAIRSFTNSCQEDEQDLAKIKFRTDVFESFSEGFIKSLAPELNEAEKMTLVYGPPMFAFMQAIRFLTDYLLGDPYYKTEYTEHNLVRTRNQFRLLAGMDENFSTMKRIVEKLMF